MALTAVPSLLASNPPAVATYSYEDLAAGTGIIEFYPGDASGAYMMSNNKFYSNKTMTSYNFTTNNSGAWCSDVDFDVQFNLPRTLKGTSIINIPIGIQADTNAIVHTSKILATIYKYDGTTPTSIASGYSDTFTMTAAAANAYGYAMGIIYIDVPSTPFKKGEYLRLNIRQFGTNGAGGSKQFFGHDPMNRATSTFNDVPFPGPGGHLTWGTDPSIATFQVPFKIDTT